MARDRAISLQFDAEIVRAVAASSKDLATFARREHGKIMRADPRPSSFRRFVDGREGAPEEAVKPFGVIEYHYQRLNEVVQFAMDTLFALSPVLSGRYRRSHTLFVNGAAVSDLKSWQPTDGEIYIVNPLPYARKIELGKQKMRVPGSDKIYQQAEQILKRRFGNIAAIKFTYRAVSDGSFHFAGRRGGQSRADRMREQDARRPALYIRAY